MPLARLGGKQLPEETANLALKLVVERNLPLSDEQSSLCMPKRLSFTCPSKPKPTTGTKYKRYYRSAQLSRLSYHLICLLSSKADTTLAGILELAQKNAGFTFHIPPGQTALPFFTACRKLDNFLTFLEKADPATQAQILLEFLEAIPDDINLYKGSDLEAILKLTFDSKKDITKSYLKTILHANHALTQIERLEKLLQMVNRAVNPADYGIKKVWQYLSDDAKDYHRKVFSELSHVLEHSGIDQDSILPELISILDKDAKQPLICGYLSCFKFFGDFEKAPNSQAKLALLSNSDGFIYSLLGPLKKEHYEAIITAAAEDPTGKNLQRFLGGELLRAPIVFETFVAAYFSARFW